MLLSPWHDPARTPLYMIMVYFAGYFALRTLFIFAPVYAWSRRAGRRVYALAGRPSPADLKYAAVSFAVDVALLAILVKSQIARVDDHHWLFTALASFAVLEIWFYVLHRALHHPRLFWIHRAHHGARVIDPLTGMAFSALERALIILGFAVGIGAISWLYPIAPGGVALYFLINYAFNMIGHSNVEVFPPSWRWLITPTHHAMHHARYDGHFGLHLTLLDRLFDTEYPDYPAVHARVWADQPLTTFAQRLGSVDTALTEMRDGARPLEGVVESGSLRPRLLLDQPATRRWLGPRVQAWLEKGVGDVGDAREWYTWAPLEGPLSASEIGVLVRDEVLPADAIVFSPTREAALRAGDLPPPVFALRPQLYVNRRQSREKREMHVFVSRGDARWSGTTLNVSRVGAALVLDAVAPLVRGDVVILACGPLELTATVVSTRALEGTLRCALEFRPLRSRERAEWEKVLRRGPLALSA